MTFWTQEWTLYEKADPSSRSFLHRRFLLIQFCLCRLNMLALKTSEEKPSTFPTRIYSKLILSTEYMEGILSFSGNLLKDKRTAKLRKCSPMKICWNKFNALQTCGSTVGYLVVSDHVHTHVITCTSHLGVFSLGMIQLRISDLRSRTRILPHWRST